MKRKLPFIDPFSFCKRRKLDDEYHDNNKYNKEWINEKNNESNWQIRWSMKYYYMKYQMNKYIELDTVGENEKCIRYGNAYTKYNKSDTIRHIYVDNHGDVVKYTGKLIHLVWNGTDGFYYYFYQFTKGYGDHNNIKTWCWYHKIGQKKDRLVYQFEYKECDNFSYHVSVTDDACYLIINKDYINESKNKTKIINLKTNQQYYICGSLNYIANQNELFYFITDKNAPNHRLITLNINKSDDKFWTTLIPETNDVLVDVVDINDQYLILKYIHNAYHIVYVHDMKTGKFINKINLPINGSIKIKPTVDPNEIIFEYQSYLVPKEIYTYSLQSKELTLFETQKESWFDPTKYKLEQVFYTSKDGTNVPMYIISKNNSVKDGHNIGLIEGYGGFGAAQLPLFDWTYIAFLDLIGSYVAIPNIRGGNEYGKNWHNYGRMEFKQNSFDDFQMAGRYLIEQNYVHPEKLIAYGASNGGLLVATCVNQSPDLFKIAIIQNAVLDMLQFHKHYQGQWWLREYGNPENKKHFNHLMNYSPLHNINNKQYPAILILASEKDNIVKPIHSYQYYDKLKESHDNCFISIHHSKLHIQTFNDYIDIFTFISLKIN